MLIAFDVADVDYDDKQQQQPQQQQLLKSLNHRVAVEGRGEGGKAGEMQQKLRMRRDLPDWRRAAPTATRFLYTICNAI